MLRSLLLVALLACPLWAETTIMPSAGKAVGVVTSTEAGKWIILAADFTPINADVRDAGKVCIFEGLPGKYAVFLIPPGDAQPKISIVILGSTGPVPPPTPGPTPGPTPNPTPPAPIAGMRVLIVYETNPPKPLTRPQLMALNSTRLRAYLNSHCPKGPDGKTPEWRMFDQHAPLVNEAPAWQALMSRPRSDLPWVVITDSSGGVVFEGAMPQSEDELLALMAKYGGA